MARSSLGWAASAVVAAVIGGGIALWRAPTTIELPADIGGGPVPQPRPRPRPAQPPEPAPPLLALRR